MGPADPYNCADGFSNWQVGWSVPKKEWCCRVHGKGCPNQGGGCAPSAPVANHTTATRDLPTGCRAGPLRRRPGAVRTKARDALQQLEDVPEHELIGPS